MNPVLTGSLFCLFRQEKKVKFQDECTTEGEISRSANTRGSVWFCLVLFFTLTHITVSFTAPKADKPKQEAQAAEENG